MKSIAENSLRKNVITLPSGKFVSAGQNQFLTLWTRDFCHAVRGLIVMGEVDVAKNHLSYLLKNVRPDGLIPRVVDNHLVQFRVSYQTLRKLVPILPKLTFKEPLKPQYVDEHGSEAIDSNLLVLLASLMVRKTSEGEKWWKEHEGELKKVFHWYDHKFKDGLIWQTAFSDWQDSVKREGHVFLTNLFYFLAASRLQKLGWNVELDLPEFKSRLTSSFFENGLYKTMKNSSIVSLDGNLFVLEADEFLSSEEKEILWKNLLAHPLTKNSLGVCSFPDYPKSDVAFHVKFADLHGYHGRLAWSWLIGLGLKVSLLMKDEKQIERQKNLIETILKRDQVVMELYDPDLQWKPWESWLLKAENPFAWGAGYLVEAFHLADDRPPS